MTSRWEEDAFCLHEIYPNSMDLRVWRMLWDPSQHTTGIFCTSASPMSC
uniref:Uncharacterized protein n=1 Tax=Picea glauca TaxID=3330 RepID=A0A117NHG7_PICGL|nr:hypothetical protein ABT39_MTgene5353 [Picea glauca]